MNGTGQQGYKTAHRHAPVDGTAYSVGVQANTGQPADLRRSGHYPVEAHCECGEMIRCDRIEQAGWTGTGRRPGDPR